MSKEIIQALRASTPCYNPGWGGPEYSGWQDEQMSWKTTCYVGDWSFLPDIEVSGPDALRVFSESCVNSFAKFDIGQVKHIIQCNSDGKVIAEGLLERIADDVFRTQAMPATWTSFLLERGGYQATWRQDQTYQLQISGPNALALCEELVAESLRDVKFMHLRFVNVAGKRAMAVRQGMAGEIGFEFHGPLEDKAQVLSAILRAGEKYGLRRLGRRTAMINHLEASFPSAMWHYTMDMFSADTQGLGEHFVKHRFGWDGMVPALTGSFEGESIGDYLFSPYELGWGRNVKFDHEFRGRAALEKEAAQPRRALVTLEFNSADMIEVYASLFAEAEPFDFMDVPTQQRWVIWADAVLAKDGRTIGISTVPGYSYYFRKILSLTVIDIAHAKPGSEVSILWGRPGTPRKTVRATVAPAPYKKDNRKADLTTLKA
jgi:vanillate/3-O-methylgallate O-demethylase